MSTSLLEALQAQVLEIKETVSALELRVGQLEQSAISANYEGGY